jgi:hypothetical protein
MIDFDDMMQGDLEPRDARAPVVLGLVVGERPKRGEFLNVEEQCYRETAALPFVLFIEEQP